MSQTTTAEHYTAWITTDLSALPGRNIDVTVLPDEITTYDVRPDGTEAPVWGSTGEVVWHGETGVDAREGDPADAIRQAASLLGAAGWSVVDDWKGVDSGFVATVERD